MEDHGRAGLARGGADRSSGDDRLRRGRGDLRRRRPAAVARAFGRGGGPGGAVGGGRGGGRGAGRDDAVRGDAGPGGGRRGEGGLGHGRRHGARRRRLRGRRGHAEVRAGRALEDGRRDAARRQRRRRRRDLQGIAVERVRGAARGRGGGRHDPQRGSAAAGLAGAVRQDGGGPRRGRDRGAVRRSARRRLARDVRRAAVLERRRTSRRGRTRRRSVRSGRAVRAGAGRPVRGARGRARRLVAPRPGFGRRRFGPIVRYRGGREGRDDRGHGERRNGRRGDARPAHRGRLPPDPARPADRQFVPAVGRAAARGG